MKRRKPGSPPALPVALEALQSHDLNRILAPNGPAGIRTRTSIVRRKCAVHYATGPCSNHQTSSRTDNVRVRFPGTFPSVCFLSRVDRNFPGNSDNP